MGEGTKHAVMGALDKKGGGKKPKAHTHSIHIRRADGGGYIAKHQMMGSDGEAQPDQEHVISDPDALQAHVASAMGDQPPAAAAPADQAGDQGASQPA